MQQFSSSKAQDVGWLDIWMDGDEPRLVAAPDMTLQLQSNKLSKSFGADAFDDDYSFD